MKAIGVFLLAALSAAAPFDAMAADPTAIKLHIGGTYDTNVAAGSAAIAAARGLTPDDEIFDPSILIDYNRKLGLQSFYLQGYGGYRFYENNHILNRENISMAGGLVRQFSNCQSALRGTYARGQTDLQDLELGPIKSTQEDISETLSGSCTIQGRLVPSFSVTNSTSTNSNQLRQSANSKSQSAQAGLLYDTRTFGKISLQGQYSETEFPRRLLGAGRADGYKVYSGGINVDRDFGSTINLVFQLSQTVLRSNSGAGVNFDGLTYSGTLDYRPTSRLEGHISFSRATTPSNRINSSYSIDQILSAEADYRLTSRLMLTLGASDTRRAYEGIALIPGFDINSEKRKSLFGTVAYDISPRTAVSFTTSRDERSSDVAAYNYNSVRVNLSISRTF